MKTPALLVAVPVYDEGDGLATLFVRSYPALDVLGISREVVFVNDGSRDCPTAMLIEQFHMRPDNMCVVLFNGSYSQHVAILAGFEHTRGERAVTLDADLRNPPEEIGRLIEKLDEGHDHAGTIHRVRQDSWSHCTASCATDSPHERTTHIKTTNQDCMLRVYNRTTVDAINRYREINTFIPALAYTFSKGPTEVEVGHEGRFVGESKCSLYKLVRLNFDPVTGFSMVPLQWFSAIGMLLSFTSAVLFILLVVRRLVLDAEIQGVFTPFATTFFPMGVLLFGTGLLGEYIGRIYQQARERPRYLVQGALGGTSHLHEAGAADLKTGLQRGVM